MWPAPTILLDRITRIIFGKEYQTGSSHVCIFYSIIFLAHSCHKMLFSAPCCRKTSAYILPLTCKVDFYLHIKPRAKLVLLIILNFYYWMSEEKTMDSWHSCSSKCFHHTGVHKHQVTQTTRFCTVTLNICGPSVSNLLQITFPDTRFLRRALDIQIFVQPCPYT
jgi:hypothetical protein